jgi:hypothetical protein
MRIAAAPAGLSHQAAGGAVVVNLFNRYRKAWNSDGISTPWIESMGAPVGNQNASKAKVWSAAINRALEKRGVSRAEALDALAGKLLDLADGGDLAALRELGDRLEGKAAQTIQGPEGEPLLGPLVSAADSLRKGLK